MLVTDTHCHLYLDQLLPDFVQVLERARMAGLHRMLVPAIDLESCSSAIALADQASEIFAAVGVHPNSARLWTDETEPTLQSYVNHPKVVAIGEIGLDYYWDFAPKELQISVLKKQLSLAARTHLPVIIHNRESTQDLLAIMLDWVKELAHSNNPLSNRPGVFHSFSADLPAALEVIEAGFLIGVTGPVTFKNAPVLRQIVQEVPLDCILVETDSPYLTPHPYRGQRNEPANIPLIINKIADIKGLPPEVVALQTTLNAQRLFLWA